MKKIQVLIAVRFGAMMMQDSFWGGLEDYFFDQLIAAVEDQ